MARKSNKTSHVLHLLAGEEPVPEAPEEKAATPEAVKEEAPAEQNQQPAQTPEEAPNVSIISTGTSEGDALADLIKDQLEEAFPEEILNSAPDSAAPEEQPADEQPKRDEQANPEPPTDISDSSESPSARTDSLASQAETADAPEPLPNAADSPEPQAKESDAPNALTAQPEEIPTAAAPVSEIPEAVSDKETNEAQEPERANGAEEIPVDAAEEAAAPQTSDAPAEQAEEEIPGQSTSAVETTAPLASDAPAEQAEEEIPGQSTNAVETIAPQTSDAAAEQATELSADADAGQTPDVSSAANKTNADAQEPEAAPQAEQPAMSRAHLDSVLYPDKDAENHNYQFVNVMEYIIKDMVIDYMKKFDMCTCERCVVDTTALALTYCPAKYIVVDKHSVSPLLNYYSNRYVGDVTVELTKACILVKENPRH